MPGRVVQAVSLALAATLVPLVGCTSPRAQTPAEPSVSTAASSAASFPSIPSTAGVSNPGTTVASLRFAIASDGHLGDAKAADPAQDFADLVEAFNGVSATAGLDFAVLNGDLTDRGGVANEEKAKAALAGLTMPVLVTQGNHDRLTAEQWNAVWGAPANQALTYGGYSLILVNTSNQAGDELCANTAWLAEALKETAGQGAVLVVMHVTPNTWTKYGVDCPEVRSMIAAAGNVRAVFNGHDHDQIGMKMSLGVRYFFDGHFGGHWGTAQKTFREVELNPNGLTTTVRTTTGEELSRSSFSWN
jgi:Predicted phosphohydrolases